MLGNTTEPGGENHRKTFALTVNPWWLCIGLALALVLCVALWRPWNSPEASDQTVSVTGSAKIQAEPDEYTFMPSYTFKTDDKAAGLEELTAKSTEVVAGLKKVGVADKDIKTNASGYRDYYYFDESTNTHTYTLTITAVSHTRQAAQKVQDYLLSTTPTGSVTPQVGFSTVKQKQLESQGRDEATKDARAKADQQATNLGFKVGRVKSVTDTNTSQAFPMYATDMKAATPGSEVSLPVQPGQNDLTYTVQVVYFIR